MMPNQEHLQLLMQGVNIWNTWRWERRGVQPHLNRAALGHMILRGIDLSHVEYIDQDYADLEAINLHHADLQGATFQSARINQANLRYADLRHANLGWTQLSGSDLSGANLVEAELNGADLHNAYLRNANLSRCMLPDANLRSADLRNANMRGASLHDANMRDARLYSTDFSDARLDNADLRGAILRGSQFRKTNLQHANLSGADLTEVDLTGADLRHANLSNTILIGANLSQAQFGWTMLGDHDLRRVHGLDTIEHLGPSSLSINTLTLSNGQLSEAFLRGTGAADSFLELVHLLTSRFFEAPLLSSEASIENTADESERRYWSAPTHYVPDPTFSDIKQEIEEEIVLVLSEKKRAGRAREDARWDAHSQAYVYAQNHHVEVSEDWLQETVDRVFVDLYEAKK